MNIPPLLSVSISKSGCWDVTYTSRRVCALVGSTVDISCTYSHPSGSTVYNTFWHYVQPGGFKDLREDQDFAGRVEYVGNKLRVKELKIMNDKILMPPMVGNCSQTDYSAIISSFYFPCHSNSLLSSAL
uniref:Immunoglobulin V-set domain-containing protein n=1 Tax=Sinocyclocheilus anshuiensis TaxID=1608454 RepID=A0A671MTZ8_9TELE